MFTVAALISRYFFLAYILVFGASLIFNARAVVGAKTLMRLVIVLTHIHGFALLCFEPGADILARGILGGAVLLILIFFFYIFHLGESQIPYIALFLTVTGIVILTSLDFDYAARQAMFFAVVALLLAAMKLFVPRLGFLPKLWPAYLSLCVILLAIVFLFGSEEYGATNWIRIGGFSFQPSEFVKIFYVLFMASLFGGGKGIARQLLACAASALVCLLLVLHKDLGGAAIVFFTFLLVFYSASGNFVFCLVALGCAVAAFAAGVIYFPEHFSHVVVRAEGWLSPFAYPDTSGYQLIMSLFAICSYGPLGIGLTRGMSVNIPFVEKDFIFAPICESFGFVFGAAFMLLYLGYFLKTVACGGSKRGFYRLAALGIAVLTAVQSIVILGANTGFLPITGVTLPFVSYGGSSLLSCYIMMGIAVFSGKESAHER